MKQQRLATIALISLIIISLVSFVQPAWAVSKYYYGSHIIYVVSNDDGVVYTIIKPEAVRFVGKYNRTYFAYITPDGYIKVFYFDHETKTFSQIVTVATNPIGTDTHGAPALLIDPQGYIHIFYGSHNSAQYYIRSVNPEDITSWTTPKTITNSATYPIARYYNGTIYVFFRGPSVYQHSYVYSTDGGETWNGPVTFIDFGSPAIYRSNVIIDSQGRFHVVWTIFDYSDNTRKHVYYAWSPDLQTWYSANGTNLGSVIDSTEANTYCKVYDSTNDPKWIYYTNSVTYYMQAHSVDIAIDQNGNPIILYQKVIDGTGDGRLLYRLAVWNGTAWEHYDIAETTARTSWGRGALEVVNGVVHAYIIIDGQLFDAYTSDYVNWNFEPLSDKIGVEGVQLVENYTPDAKLFISYGTYIAIIDGPAPAVETETIHAVYQGVISPGDEYTVKAFDAVIEKVLDGLIFFDDFETWNSSNWIVDQGLADYSVSNGELILSAASTGTDYYVKLYTAMNFTGDFIAIIKVTSISGGTGQGCAAPGLYLVNASDISSRVAGGYWSQYNDAWNTVAGAALSASSPVGSTKFTRSGTTITVEYANDGSETYSFGDAVKVHIHYWASSSNPEVHIDYVAVYRGTTVKLNVPAGATARICDSNWNLIAEAQDTDNDGVVEISLDTPVKGYIEVEYTAPAGVVVYSAEYTGSIWAGDEYKLSAGALLRVKTGLVAQDSFDSGIDKSKWIIHGENVTVTWDSTEAAVKFSYPSDSPSPFLQPAALPYINASRDELIVILDFKYDYPTSTPYLYHHMFDLANVTTGNSVEVFIRSGTYRIMKKIGGSSTVTYDDTSSVAENTWYRGFRVVLRNGTIEFYRHDGGLMTTIDVSDLGEVNVTIGRGYDMSTGSGLYTSYGWIDNVIICNGTKVRVEGLPAHSVVVLLDSTGNVVGRYFDLDGDGIVEIDFSTMQLPFNGSILVKWWVKGLLTLPGKSLKLVHRIVQKFPSTAFNVSFEATNTTTAGYSNTTYGFKVYANPYDYNGTSYENTAKLLLNITVDFPYASMNIENLTILARTNSTGSFRQLWVKILNSSGGVVAELTNATLGTDFTEIIIPINSVLTDRLTIWINATVTSTNTTGEEIELKDIMLYANYTVSPVFVVYLDFNVPSFDCEAEFDAVVPSYLNESYIKFWLIDRLNLSDVLYNGTSVAVTSLGTEVIDTDTYNVYRVDNVNASAKLLIKAKLINTIQSIAAKVKGVQITKVIIGEEVVFEVPEPSNITLSIGTWNATYYNVTSITWIANMTGTLDVIANLTETEHYKIGRARISLTVKYGEFDAVPRDSDGGIIDYEELELVISNATTDIIFTGFGSRHVSGLVAGNYTITVKHKGLTVAVATLTINSTTDGIALNISCALKRAPTDYRGLGKVFTWDYDKNASIEDISAKYPFSRTRVLLNGTGSFTLIVNYKGDLPTKVSVVSNVSNLNYYWNGSYLVITGTLGSVGEINITDLYKVRLELYDRLGNLMPSWIYAYVNETKYSGAIVEDYYYPEDYVIKLPATINGFEFYSFFDGFNESIRAISINNSDITLKAWYRVPTNIEVKSYQVSSTFIPFIKQEGETVKVYVEGYLKDYYGNGVPNRPLTINITNVETGYTKSYNVSTDAVGYFRSPVVELFRGKTYKIEVIYNGDDIYVGTIGVTEVKPEEL